MFKNSSFVSDGLTGIQNACLSVFPKAMHKSCWAQISQNIVRLVIAKDRKEIFDTLKSAYQSKSEKEANLNSDTFISSVSSVTLKLLIKLRIDSTYSAFYPFQKRYKETCIQVI